MQPPPPSLVLRVELGPGRGQTFECNSLKRCTIGRTKANSFQIKDDAISQKHLSIECKDGQWFVQDLGSSNGTSVNGVNLGKCIPVAVCHEDLLRIGIDTRIRVVLQQPSILQEPPKEKQHSRRRGSSQVPSFSMTDRSFEQTPSLHQELCTVKQASKRRGSAQPQMFSVFNDDIKQATLYKESCGPKLSLRQRGLSQVRSVFQSMHDDEPSRKKSAQKQGNLLKKKEMTLRDWFAQQLVVLPKCIEEKGKGTVLEIQEHAEELKRVYKPMLD